MSLLRWMLLAALLSAALFAYACAPDRPPGPTWEPLSSPVTTQPRAAAVGDTVTVRYKGFLENGEMFDSSHAQGRPHIFVIGSGTSMTGFDEAVCGLRVGQSAKFYLDGAEVLGRPVEHPFNRLTYEITLQALG